MIKYIEQLGLAIYEHHGNIYGISDYLDIAFNRNNDNLIAIEGSTCKHGSFRELDREELEEITSIVNR